MTPPPDLRIRLDTLRRDLVETVLRLACGFGLVLVAGNVARALDGGWRPVFTAYVALYLMLLAVTLAGRRAPLVLKEAVLILVLLGGGFCGLITFGILGNTGPVWLTACVLAAALYGRGAGAVAVALGTLGYGAVAVAVVTGWHVPAIDPAAYAGSPLAWTSALATLLACAAIALLTGERLLAALAGVIAGERRARAELDRRIAGHRVSEAALRRTERVLARSFDVAPDWISLHDPADGRLLEVNRAFERMTGYAREAALGRRPEELALGQEATFWRALLAGEAGEAQARIIVEGIGREIAFTRREARLRDSRALLLLGREVTGRNAARQRVTEASTALEARVAQRNRELLAARADLEGFIASVSQDLRGPLAAAAVELGGADAGRLPPALLEQLRRSLAEADALVDSLAALSRVYRHRPEPRAIDLAEFARDCLARLDRAMPGRPLRVRLPRRLTVLADPVLAAVVLEQLLDNAWKFTRGRPLPEIELGLCPGGGPGRYFVRDNGAGFDPAHAGRLFEPFERLHAPSEFPGAGIGLALAAQALRRMGGEIRGRGVPGVGAEFDFTLGGESP